MAKLLFFYIQDDLQQGVCFDIDSVDSQKKSDNDDTHCSSFETKKEKEIQSQSNVIPANDDTNTSNDQQNDAVISFDEIEDRKRDEDRRRNSSMSTAIACFMVVIFLILFCVIFIYNKYGIKNITKIFK